ncbi:MULTISPECIES: glycosyltransferase [unclassified Undibacterium]|uniref:glycosyltransferase n=1 Tax=unclassified Undibacterium TaxID=2630295 RepID=UPI002AC9A12D|nr:MULTISPECIES: glycosyltransferase [unclassified Undibacterium]MEB0140843.1 glycosyltransferase [Undibacterium sp. CCC2.1]MEB0173812.1 glycosyltransferase [Undibacterium sp. CCC1.1]MEB0177796.1 glycosyltransferase [Undibacterium sp. CCC3.4]MEB0217342.1 glycosyltransferase [Undibacterium sp. 5I2]WPX42155.1 glycosyltransferase [Undibacterium sp. CCC3.4]
MKLKVAIAYTFNDKDWFGGRNYFASLFESLQLQDISKIQFVFITGNKTETTLPEEFPFLEVIRTSILDRMNPAWLLRQFTLRGFDSDPILARFLLQKKIDLLSHSGYLGNKPGIKTLPWLFDFQFMHLPEHWTESQLRWVKRRYMTSCEQCDGVIVSSADALKDLMDFYPKSKVDKHVLRFVSNPIDFSKIVSLDHLMNTYDLPEKYLYLPNQFWTHKNHKIVIDALAILKKQGVNVTVVCTGQTKDLRRPNYFSELMHACEEAGVSTNFKVLGVIPFQHAQSMMVHALAVLNPSRFEGWSTTVEEAKTLNKRLLLSDLAVHKEQAPTFGKFFSPDNADQLAQLMVEIFQEKAIPLDEKLLVRDYKKRQHEFALTYLNIINHTLELDCTRKA